jgi:RNA polymerase sigma factor (sigma-70 family)
VSTGSAGSATGYLTALFRAGTLSSKSDSELLEQFIGARREQDESAELAFSALLKRHGSMVLRVCRGVLGDEHLAEDAFQATFLILAGRAKSIRRQVSVGSWLYGVALRVATTERSRAARRKRHEQRRAMMITESTASAPPDDDEAARALHQEIGLLPERYRSAVVLCYLEGLTHEAAALRLDRPVGTVRSRLATARDRLRARLIRRGLAPALVPAFATPDAVPTIVPAALEEATVRASLEVLLGRTALRGVASGEAIALMEGMLRTMTITRWVVGIASVVAAGFITLGAGVMAYSALLREETKPPGRLADVGAIVPGADEQEKALGQVLSPAPNQQPVQGQRGASGGSSTSQVPFLIQAETVDGQGKPLSGVEVGLSVSYLPNTVLAESRMERGTSDDQGRFRIEVVEKRPGRPIVYAELWAFKPGRAVGTIGIPVLGKTSPGPVRVVLDEPVKRTITVVGADGRPIAGLTLVPRSLGRRSGVPPLSIPEEWRERLVVTTDVNGAATIPYLSRAMYPASMRVFGPEIARHTLPLPEQQGKDDYVLKLGGPGRLVGLVRSDSGQPLAGVPVAVWVRSSGALLRPGYAINRGRITHTEVVPFDSEPARTGPEGAFQTPSKLLWGSTYRVSIRREGFEPFVSEWVTLDGERTAVAPIRLRALRTLAGFVRDRQGQGVAGARVFVPSHGPETTTDARGRFALTGVGAEKTFVLVNRPGFRFQGWTVDPAAQTGELTLALARTNEDPAQIVAPLSGPVSEQESKALARRLIEPYVAKAIEKADVMEIRMALRALIDIDRDRVLEVANGGKILPPRFTDELRRDLALNAVKRDPAGATAMAESMILPGPRGFAFVELAAALPVSERARKQALLERATLEIKAVAQPSMKLGLIMRVMKGWLDLGMAGNAKLLTQEGQKVFDSFPPGPQRSYLEFRGLTARIDPASVLEEIRKIGDAELRGRSYNEVAIHLALEHPAEAEQAFNLYEDRFGFARDILAMRLCRRLAKVDLPRARRIAAAADTHGARASAWAYTALGAAERDKQAAREALDHSIEAIDRILESGPGLELVTTVQGATIYPTNPAVVILPIVEQVAPERLAEFFWRAVALHDRVDPDGEESLLRSGIGFECMLLSRYDRQVAAAFFEPMDSFIRSVYAQKSRGGELSESAIVAKACLDPKAAVELLEFLVTDEPQPRGVDSRQVRLFLTKAFVAPAAERWKLLWGTMGWQLPLDDEPLELRVSPSPF